MSETRQKTVTDIWAEVQEEQRRFNKIVRYLVGALIVAFLVAGIAAVQSWFKLNDLSGSYQEQIDKATAQAAISRSDANRQRQSMRNELIDLRETIAEQRKSATLPREVDRALAGNVSVQQFKSERDVVSKAIELAEASALGRTLNSSTAYVIDAVLEAVPAPETAGEPSLLDPADRRLLEAIQQAWIDPRSSNTRAIWTDFLEHPGNEARETGIGHAGLGLFHYSVAQENSLSWNAGCQRAVDNIREARRYQQVSVPLLLAQGECLRKHGEKLEAFKAFLEALEMMAEQRANVRATGEGELPPINSRRMAAHGAGTTLIALEVGARRDEDLREQLTKFESRLGAIDLPEPKAVEDNEHINALSGVLASAMRLMVHAAELRTERGEGRIGSLYTRENIGFIYLLSEDWPSAIAHARDIDADMAMGWNLTVLLIALTEQAEAERDAGDRAAARALESDAKRALNKVSWMSVDQVDAPELEKLLEPKYTATVEKVVAAIENNKLNAQ